MATYNLSGSSLLQLTPTIQNQGNSSLAFNQLAFNLKRTIPLTSTDYWRYQNTAFVFQHRNSVVRVRPAVNVRATHTLTFEPNYHNVQHLRPRQTNLSGSNSLSFSQSSTPGRGWRQIKNHGFSFSQSNSVAIRSARAVGATSSLTFAQTPVKRSVFQRSGSSVLTAGQSNSLSIGRKVGGSNTLTFSQVAAFILNTPAGDISNLAFSQSNTVRVTKTLSATQNLTFLSGGYGIV